MEKKYKQNSSVRKDVFLPFLPPCPLPIRAGHQLECPALTSCPECGWGRGQSRWISLESGGTQVFVKSSVSLVGELEAVGWPDGSCRCKAGTRVSSPTCPDCLVRKKPDCGVSFVCFPPCRWLVRTDVPPERVKGREDTWGRPGRMGLFRLWGRGDVGLTFDITPPPPNFVTVARLWISHL